MRLEKSEVAFYIVLSAAVKHQAAVVFSRLDGQRVNFAQLLKEIYVFTVLPDSEACDHSAKEPVLEIIKEPKKP